jgi:putative aldouronate transport system permease protein
MDFYASYFRKKASSIVFDTLNLLFILCATVVMIYPFLNILAVSLSDSAEYIKGNITIFPRHLSFDAYKLLFKSDRLISSTIMSIARVMLGTISGLFCTALLAYICSIRRFSGRKFMRLVFIVTMYFSGGLIPYYLLMLKIGLHESFLVYIVPSLIYPGFMLMISAYFDNLPEELAEAARIDGCKEMGIFLKIYLPCSLPVLACIALYITVGHWNSWFDTSLFNPSGKFDTLQVLLRKLLLQNEAIKMITNEMLKQSLLKLVAPESIRAATTVIVTFPILMVYPFLQKYFIKGVLIGAVKA